MSDRKKKDKKKKKQSTFEAEILISMSNNKETYLGVFSSKQLGELLFMSARSVSGRTSRHK